MQKIYLLLRSNKKTGPYTFEELLQLNLKPFDLVWVEGRSAAWQYPFEIPALKPYVPETPQAAIPFQPVATAAMDSQTVKSQPVLSNTKSPTGTSSTRRIFVSVPNSYPHHENPIRETAPAQPAPYAAPKAEAVKTEELELRTNYVKPLDEVEQDYTNWIYRQKTKKKSVLKTQDLVIAALILVVIATGYFVMSKPDVNNKISPGNAASADVIEPAADETATANENMNAAPTTVMVQGPANDGLQPTVRTKQIHTKNPAPVEKSQTVPSVPAQNTIPVEKTASNIPADESEASQPVTTAEDKPGEKKKKLGEMIRGIFAKKEKAPERDGEEIAIQEEPRPANNRQATHRESAEPSTDHKPAAAEISPDQIDLYSNHPDNWMMGVRNLEITLRNRSNVVIQSAVVSVKYYDENNRLLEKKSISFSNVAPNSRSKVAAPDNKWADHAEIELASLTARDDRYASHQ